MRVVHLNKFRMTLLGIHTTGVATEGDIFILQAIFTKHTAHVIGQKFKSLLFHQKDQTSIYYGEYLICFVCFICFKYIINQSKPINSIKYGVVLPIYVHNWLSMYT